MKYKFEKSIAGLAVISLLIAAITYGQYRKINLMAFNKNEEIKMLEEKYENDMNHYYERAKNPNVYIFNFPPQRPMTEYMRLQRDKMIEKAGKFFTYTLVAIVIGFASIIMLVLKVFVIKM